MNEDASANEYLESLKRARDVSAVLKIEIASVASNLPEDYRLFAYEGPADKIVYYYWIRNINAELKYEPFVCESKLKVLRLFDVIDRDRTGLKERVYFFIDRDFDGLQGREISARIFLTDRYSIENYLVCAEVLEDLLRIEFHCSGCKDLRDKICVLFATVYSEFLSITREINFRIFLARQLAIQQTDDLPSGVNKIAKISLDAVTSSSESLEDLVKLVREPSESESQTLREEFEKLSPELAYRGKFALLFFVKWLEILRQDRQADSPSLFEGVAPPKHSIKGSFSLETLAPKAPPPASLASFLQAIV